MTSKKNKNKTFMTLKLKKMKKNLYNFKVVKKNTTI